MASMKTTFLLALIFLHLQTEFISLEAIWSNSSAGNSTVGCIDMEREALLKFKEGLDFTSGTLSSWVGEDCCNWLGVGCSNRTGNIIKLDLNGQLLCDQMSGNPSAECWQPLRGVLSPSLLELKYLNYLNLSHNDLQGTIPPQIGNLSNLLYLDLSWSWNFLTASNLNWLSGLSSLKYLNLNHARLSGATTDWLQTVNLLPSLLELHLSYCGLDLSGAYFNGTIPPQIGNLSNLLYLDLSWNFLPASNLNWLSGLSSLKYLNLNGARLSEATTDWLQTVNLLPSLLELHLSDCGLDLSYALFDHLGNLSNLLYLDLSDAYLDRTIPPHLGNLSNLLHLDLSWRYLTASNLNWLSGLSSLKYLNLNGARLSDATTDWLQTVNLLPSLLELHLSDCGLDLPYALFDHLGNLSNLLSLDLSGAYLNGTILPHLGNLSNLLSLDLSWSFLTASNLNWFSGLSSLKYLNLNYARLSDATTDWLQTVNLLPSLLELHLSYCELHHLPQNFPSVNFTSLSVLDLSDNDFNSSSIPQWVFNFTSLTELRLSYCNLTGSIPKIAKGNLCKLQTLDLSDNNLSGEITEFFQALSECSNSSLEELYLSQNKLIGNIPHSLGNLKCLRWLLLFGNAFSGSIPSSIQNLSRLELLNLFDNKMNGTVPESIGQLSELRVLHLFGNYWQGNMTETHFLNLTKLYWFSLSSSSSNPLVFNVKHDWIPPFSLQYVNILDCQLNPTFPAWLRTQNELTEIHLVNTAISDTIPNWFWNLSSQLVELDLSHNKLMGNLPKSLNLSSLQRVYLDFNHLEGSLPLWPNVTVFSLRSNSLSGPIPIRIGQEMSQLVELDLSDNSLNGSIPSSIDGLRVLGSLRLSNNCLSGNIHNNWQGMLNLFFIDLSRNNLSGGIPSSMCSLPHLSWLQLSDNNLSGNLSLGLKFLSRWISTLDFGGNRLSGTIPTWIGERNFSIRILRLRGNMLYGKIPKQLCNLTNIHVLDLAQNYFSGSIPTCLGSLVGYIDSNVVDHRKIPRYMDLVVKGRQYEYTDVIFLVKIMDFSRNSLSGEIPAELTSLTLLNSLNLSWNQLTGNIPENIGSLRQLETLDLSSNQLSGHIPPSMSSMNFLSHLNLSYNNLSGQIPSTGQFQTFNDPSIYEGNPQLYGPPPMPSDRNAEHKDQEDIHVHNNGEDQFEKLWFYLSIALGFIVGFWVVCGSLLIKKSWRHTYFCFAEKMKDRLLVVIALNMAHLQRKIQAERH